jgi:NADH-quinone oxidoreductase subunit L
MVVAGVYLVADSSRFIQSGHLMLWLLWLGLGHIFTFWSQLPVLRPISRVLAYSTMSQIGYMMLALGVSDTEAKKRF